MVVNVNDLMVLGLEGSHPHGLSQKDLRYPVTLDWLVYFNYDDYPSELRPYLIEGYSEGSTTTPLDMMLCHRVSRFHAAEAAVGEAAKKSNKVRINLHGLTTTGYSHNIFPNSLNVAKTHNFQEFIPSRLGQLVSHFLSRLLIDQSLVDMYWLNQLRLVYDKALLQS